MQNRLEKKTKCIIELYDDVKMKCIGLREWGCNNIVSRTLYLIFIKIMFRILCLGILRFYSKIEYIECDLREAKFIKIISCEEVFVEEIMYLHLNESETKSIDIKELESEVQGINLKNNYFRYFIHKKLRYYWSEKNQIFLEIQGLDNILTTEEIYSNSSGLSQNEFEQRLKFHGLNKMQVEVVSYFKLYMSELLDPFCLVQIISIIIWCCDDYYFYAITIFLILMITISINTYNVKKNLTRLHKMVYICTTINVLQENGDFVPKDSVELVPGDVIRVPGNGSIIPCDCVLISGNCIVNESMLTGECFPTTKTSLPLNELENTLPYSTQTCKNNTLFSGTTVCQLRSYEHTHVLAIVINTGFCTYKGRMIHSVIFPKLIKFAFFRDSLKFISLLAAMSLAGVIYCIYIFVKMEGTYSLIIRKSLDMITLLVPPCLPAALAVATIYSMNRLKWFGISCIDPTRINICGKLKMFCFDKTGTLTEEYITISGVLDTQSIGLIENGIKELVFNKRIETTVHNMDNKNILYCMATCHSLYNIDGKLAGDPIDTVMFESTQWTLNNNEENDSNNRVEFAGLNIKTVEPPLFSKIQLSNEPTSQNTHTNNPNGEFDIKLDKVFHSFSLLKTYQFESVLQRMTVITKDIEDKQIIVFSKGSPESIQKLCTPESIPKDFQKVLFSYAEKGYRILGMACKFLDKSQTWHKTMLMKRTEIEQDMVFLGFLLLHNKLKPKSADVVNYLTSLNTRMCMVTGDNMLTALSIGCECGIISIDQSIIQVQAVVDVSCKDENLKELKIKYTEHQYSKFVFESNTDLFENVLSVSDMIPHSNNSDSKKNKNSCGTSNHNLKQLVIDGESFDLIKTYETQENYQKLLVSGVIFARMSPQQKTTLVKDLQSLGYVVAMVGDGANDCGALKAAHAGIALAMSEASVVAPFTTRDGCLSCVPTLLSEGRTSLATAFSMFKFILMYSFTQFTSVLILYHCHTVFSNGKFLFIDIFILGPILSTMLNLAPAKFIHKKRPLGRLAHPLIFFSLFGYFALQFGLHFFVLKMVKANQWFVPVPYIGGEELESISLENTAVFCSLNFLYIFSSIAVSFGPPHRRFFICNKNYLLSLFVTLFVSIVLLLYPGTILQDLISLDDIPSFNFRIFILCISIFVGMCVILWEYALSYSSIVRKFVNIFRFKKRHRNLYKAVVKEILSDKSWPSDSIKPIIDYDDNKTTFTS